MEHNVSRCRVLSTGLGSHHLGLVFGAELTREDAAIDGLVGPRQIEKVLSVGEKARPKMAGFLGIHRGGHCRLAAFGGDAEDPPWRTEQDDAFAAPRAAAESLRVGDVLGRSARGAYLFQPSSR